MQKYVFARVWQRIGDRCPTSTTESKSQHLGPDSMDQDAPQKPIDRGEKGYDPSTVERERERVRFFLGESALRIASTIAQSM